MKENHCKDTFAGVVEYPNHDNTHQHCTGALPKNPCWRLVHLAVWNNVP
jgi:hypothetical protein